MAEAFLSGVVEGIVGTLTSSVLQEIGLWWGVKDEIQLLHTKVRGVKVVLRDAEDRQARGDVEVKEWIDELKEVLYDADDLLDDFSTEVLRRQVMSGNKATKKVRLFFSSSNQLAYGLKMGRKIKAIRKRLDDVMGGGMRFNFRDTSTFVMAKKRGQTHSSAPEVVVGREVEKNAITQLLLSADFEANVSVISIVGIGGLGKTTLAQLIYNDKSVRSQFELRVWVCVSDHFDVQVIVEKILESLTGERPNMSEIDTLKNSLHGKIRAKRYLLVLDDVWNLKPLIWGSLTDLLAVGSKGSRILVTTRSKMVAKITSPSQAQYELSGLSDKDSWSLFAQMAFKQSEPPAPIKAIGKKIVTKCRGVPLAIRAIGGLMCLKETIGEWESFERKELTMMDQEENGILAALKLSYDHLSPHLKHCFVYCRLFPKDHEIYVDTLVALWMAQGYIKLSSPSQCLEDIGRECFMNLLWRSFFQEVEKDELGNIISCKMHDLMHDLASSSSVVGVESAYVSTSNPREIGKKTLHFSFDTLQFPVSVLEAKSLRTFLKSEGGARCKIVEGQCQAIFCNLKRLRQLDLQASSIETVPSSIGKLKHLRYLNLSQNKKIQMLPRSITRLQNLQVLKLIACRGLTQLPKDIKKLVSLRQLDISECDALTHMPRGIGRLTSLEKLTRFVLPESKNSKWKQQENQSGGLDELHDLNNLGGQLSIEYLPHHYGNVKYNRNKTNGANLGEKPRLQVLRFEWVPFDSEDDVIDNEDEKSLEALQPHPNLKKLFVLNYGGMKFASWLSSLTNLVRLELYDCPKCRSLPALDQFPSLKRIEIKGLTDLEYIDIEICSSSNSSSSNNNNSMVSFFPSLELLWLHNCPNLKGWRPSSPSSSSSLSLLPQFQCLSQLWISSCPNLTSMPPLPPSLKKLDIRSAGLKSLELMLKGTISPAAHAEGGSAICSSSNSSSNNNSTVSFFPSLERMHLYDCPNLEYIDIEICSSSNSSSSSNNNSMVSFFPSLERMELYYCPNLKGWRPSSPSSSSSSSSLLPQFQCLSELAIWSCPNLTSMPPFPSLKELKIFSGSFKTLEQMLKGTISPAAAHDDAPSSSSSLPSTNNNNNLSSSLKTLDISEIEDMPEDFLPAEFLQTLTSLATLWISDCPTLTCLPHAKMLLLTSLKSLQITSCEGLDLSNYDDDDDDNNNNNNDAILWQGPGLRSLTELRIEGIPKLVHLPRRLLLRSTVLRILYIRDCPNLESLPEWMPNLTSLQELCIRDCSLQLSERCKNNMGEDWPKIAHIPDVMVHLTYPYQH